MTDYRIVPAHRQHAILLARTMREPDIDEIAASDGTDPLTALLESCRRSVAPKTGLVDGNVICMFGVASPTALSRVGVPWLLGSTLLPKHAVAFLRRNRGIVEGWLQEYDRLVGYADVRNTLALKWLAWLGFKLGEPRPFGVRGLPFIRFEA